MFTRRDAMFGVQPRVGHLDVNQIDSRLADESLPRRRRHAIIARRNQIEFVGDFVVAVNARARDGVDFDGINAQCNGIDALAVGTIDAVRRPKNFQQLRLRQIAVDEISTGLALTQRLHDR